MAICSFFSVSNFYFTSQYHQLPLSHPAAAGAAATRPPPPPPPRLILNLLILLLLHPHSLPPSHHPPPPSMHVYTLFFRIETNHPGIDFVRDYASRDQIYHFIHLALRNTTVRTRTALEYYTTTSNISKNNNFFCNY